MAINSMVIGRMEKEMTKGGIISKTEIGISGTFKMI